MVDISRVTYEVELITETGATYALRDVVTELSWEEQADELAQRAKLTLVNFKTDAGYLIDIAKLNCFIMIYANWDGTRHRMFGGSIWEWEYTSANEKELSLTAYDPLIRLQQSKHRQYYPPGMGTKQIIQDVCDEWGIPLDYGWVSISHPKKALQTQAISDIIIGLLEEVKNKTASKYTVLFRDEKMQIREQGSNASVYEFTGENVVSTTDRLSLRDLITRIKIIGKAEENTRPPIEAVVEGRTEFGVLQEILVRDSDKTLADAKAEAETLMKERGQPSEDISVTTVDLPFLRKGDRVRMNAGNLLGYFYVTGVSHNAIDKIMTMELCR